MSNEATRVSPIVAPKTLFTVAVLLGAGYLIGVTSREAIVQADGRPAVGEQEHFRSGAQRSELLLREISTTLGKMDARMERMEKLATQIANRREQPLPGATP